MLYVQSYYLTPTRLVKSAREPQGSSSATERDMGTKESRRKWDYLGSGRRKPPLPVRQTAWKAPRWWCCCKTTYHHAQGPRPREGHPNAQRHLDRAFTFPRCFGCPWATCSFGRHVVTRYLFPLINRKRRKGNKKDARPWNHLKNK